MYRGRLGEELDGDVKGYVSSTESDAGILAHDVLGTKAHVLMLYKTGIITRGDAARILAALNEIGAGGDFRGDGHGDAEDGHELLERLVAERAGESGGRMHTARSRNDQVALATRLKIRADAIAIQGGILALAGALLDQAGRHTGTRMPLYTHLQRAQPGLLSHYMIAQTDALLRDHQRFQDMHRRLDASPLGAGPVAGSNLPIDRLATAEMLSFGGIVENSLDATSARDYISEFVSCTAIMMVNLSRMAEDFILWSSDEFSFIELADGVSSPSSAMPQKKNPDVLELTRGKAARTVGDLVAVLTAQKGLASGYGRDLQETKEPAWSASGNGRGALGVMLRVVAGMKVNRDAMGRAADGGEILALGIAEELVRLGVPFRRAHADVGSLVLAAHAAGKTLDAVDESDVRGACSSDAGLVLEAVARGAKGGAGRAYASAGSSSAAQQGPMIGRRRETVASLSAELDGRRKKIADRAAKLDGEIGELLSRP